MIFSECKGKAFVAKSETKKCIMYYVSKIGVLKKNVGGYGVIAISSYVFLVLISENLFCGNSLDWSDFLKSLYVEVLLIAEDEVAPRLASHILVFELHDVF